MNLKVKHRAAIASFGVGRHSFEQREELGTRARSVVFGLEL
ncbi:MAG: hypothetical protein ABI625_18435 [bacterium]